MAQERTYGGFVYRQAAPGQPWVKVGPAAGGRVIPKSATTQQKEGAEADKASADAQAAAGAAPYAAPIAAANVGKTVADTAVTQEALTQAITERERGNVKEETRTKALDAFNAAPALEDLANDIEAAYKNGVGQTGGISGLLDYLPTGQNREFGLIGGRARGTFKQALGFTGGEGNTAGELTINYGPYIPDQYDTNEEVLRKIANIRQLAQDARKKSISYLGGIPDPAGRVTPLPKDITQDQVDAIYSGAPVSHDDQGRLILPSANLGRKDPGLETNGVVDKGSGGLSPVPEFRGMAGDVQSLIQQGASADEVIGYIAKRHRDAGFAPPNDERKQFIRDVVAGHEKRPDVPVSSLGSSWQSLEMVENPDEGGTFMGGIADSPFGAGAISAANAVTAGNLGNLAGDNAQGVIDYSRAERPLSSFAGDVIGSGIAMAGVNRLAGLVPGGGALTGMSGLGGDALYGTTRGFSEGDGDWRYGLLGGASAIAGNRAGAALFGGDRVARPVEMALDTAPGRRVAQLLGTEVPARPSAAQRIIARDVGDNGDAIARMLAEGQALDVPVTLADTTPQLRARAGSAFRNAGQEARDTVAQFQQGRQLGQADRALGQIEQSFGPVSNPNRVAEALTQQAKTTAAPLYDAAYAAPGASVFQIDDLLSRPSMNKALGNAMRIAKEEGRDPMQLGFVRAEGAKPGDELIRIENPSWQTLDYVKRGLDDVVEGYRDKTTGKLALDTEGRAVNGTLRELMARMDQMNPDYAAARQAYAGPVQARQAMEGGRGFLRATPRDIEDQIAGMSPEQQDMYRLGARTALSDRVEQARLSTNPLGAIYGSPVAQQRIASVFPEGADRFRRAYGLETEMARTGQELLGGSPTASRLAADQQLSDQIGEQLVNGAVDTAITGAPIRTGVSLLGKGLAATGVGRMKEGVANEIAQILALQAEPDVIAQLLAETAARRRYIDDLRGLGSRSGSALLAPAAFAGGGNE